MILTEEQQAERSPPTAAATRSSRRRAQGAAPRALPPPTPRDGAPIAADRDHPSRDHSRRLVLVRRGSTRGEALRIDQRRRHVCVGCWSPGTRTTPASASITPTPSRCNGRAALRKGRRDPLRHGPRAVPSSRTPAARMTPWPAARPRPPTQRDMAATIRNTRDNFMLAAGKLGLDAPRSSHACITFFAPVECRRRRPLRLGRREAPAAPATSSICAPRWTCWSRSPTARIRSIPRRTTPRAPLEIVTLSRSPPSAPTISAAPAARKRSAPSRTTPLASA